MTLLAEIHAGHDPTIYRIPCLELSSGRWANLIRACPGWDDITVTHEDGQQAVYPGEGLDVALPNRNDSGQQRLVFAMGGVNAVAEELIEQSIEAGEIIYLTLRMYASNNLGAPAQRPKVMIVDTPEMLPDGTLQVPCTYRDILSRRFLQGRFTANKYPGVALF
ncbi:DUF1833 family protein [Vreelandella populi]|uniref:DUF1833 domain-containing protein n=1 Tax=Vreelandella populi TaxID=2498858 RepID=A0A3S0YEL4_9GAMM|nr:DUF1833 family protein [Halomonas populi]RUR48784.1 DUF1833 domain-containing protein [Halomonas populi]